MSFFNIQNIQRTVVIDDTFNFWRAGMLKSAQVLLIYFSFNIVYSYLFLQALAIAETLKTEDDYVVWYTAVGELNFVHVKMQVQDCVQDYEVHLFYLSF